MAPHHCRASAGGDPATAAAALACPSAFEATQMVARAGLSIAPE